MESNVRVPALLLVIAGIIIALGIILHPDETQPGAFSNPLWMFVHVVIGIAFILLVFGLQAFPRIYGNKLNGYDKFTLAFLAVIMILLSGLIFYFEAFVVPAIANSSFAAALDGSGPVFTTIGPILMLTFLAMSLSFILFGILTIYKKVSNPLAGILIIIGAPLISFAPPLPWTIGIIGGVALGLGIVWTGISLYQRAR